MKKRNGTTLALGLTSLALSIAAFAGASLTKGAMQAKAADTLAYTLDTTAVTGSNNSYTGNCDVTVDGITWNVTGNATTKPWRVGGKSITNAERSIYTKNSISKAISRIDLTLGSISTATVNSLNLVVASDNSFATVIETVPVAVKASSVLSIVPSDGTTWAASSFYKFVFNITNSTKSTGYVQFSKVEMYEPLSESTTFPVSYDANDGTGAVTDSNEYLAGATATVLSGDALSKENYEFSGWNTEADGSGTAYAPGDSLVVSGATTLYAQWNRTHYAVTYDPNGGNGEAFTEKVAVADVGSYVAASGSAFTNGSFPFDGWATSAAGSVVYAVGDSVPLTDDLTLYAHWEIPAMEKIASNDELYDGMTILIGDADGAKVMGEQRTNNRAAVGVTDSVPGAGYATFTLGVEDTKNGVRYTFHSADGYLYAASSGSNHLKSKAALDVNGLWDIDLSKPSIIAKESSNRNVLQLNSTLFSCYNGANYAAVAIFAMPQTITDEQVANTFIKKYMHMVSAPVGETGAGKCVSESWYATAKEAFNKLTEDQRLLVTDNADVYARLEAWAVANGDEMTGDLILASKSAPFRSEAGVSQEKNAAAIALIALAGGASAGALVFFLRKKKQDR